jgi:hemolysin III
MVNGVSMRRPRMRGVSHRIACLASLPAGAALIACARDARAAATAAIYGALLVGMFGTSAALHAADWRPATLGWLRRADHAMIFAFIAATYTPLAVIGVGGEPGARLLALAWVAAAVGIVRAVAWPHAPRAIVVLLYVAVGWVVLADVSAVRAALGPVSFGLVIAGGAAYTVGAAIYAARWPDPWPAVFGYHEVFHVLIIVGCACHFVAVARVVTT